MEESNVRMTLITIKAVIALVGFFTFIEICTTKNKGKGYYRVISCFSLVMAFLAGIINQFPSIEQFAFHFPRAFGESLGIFSVSTVLFGLFHWINTIGATCALCRMKREEKQVAEQERQEAQEKTALRNEEISNANKLKALEELGSGNLDKLTWANALIAAEGDEIKAKAEYLKLRK